MTKTEHVLKKPIVTEKTVAQTDKFSFKIKNSATKGEVKKAVKEFYGVEAQKINIINLPQKTKTFKKGLIGRKRAPFKKAIVTLKKGTKIDFNAFK